MWTKLSYAPGEEKLLREKVLEYLNEGTEKADAKTEDSAPKTEESAPKVEDSESDSPPNPEESK